MDSAENQNTHGGAFQSGYQVQAPEQIAHKIGHNAGLLFSVIIFILLFVKHVKRLGAPDTSFKGVLSLVMMIVVILWCDLVKILFPDFSKYYSGLLVGFILLNFVVMVAVMVLAIIALAEFKKDGAIYGRKSAIWALMLASLNLFFGGVVFVNTLDKPKLEAHSSSKLIPRDYVSVTSGFSVKLSDTTWVPVAHSQASQSAECVVVSGATEFIVIPIDLGKLHVDLEVLNELCTSTFGVAYPSSAVTDVKSVTHGSLKGNSLVFERIVESAPWIYKTEVLEGNGFAYFLIAFGAKAGMDSEATAKLNDILARVSFDSEPIHSRLDRFTSGERKAKGFNYNELGLLLYKREQVGDGLDFFRKALECEPDKPIYIQNVADALMQKGSYREAASFLEAHESVVNKSNPLQTRFAYVKQQTGDVEGALNFYAKAFSDNYTENRAFEAYIGLLCTQKKLEEAAAVIERYSKGHESTEISLLQALVYRLQKKFDLALGILENQHAAHPDNSEVATSLAGTLLAAERFVEAGEQCDKLIDAGKASATVYILKGRSESGLRHFKEAKASFEKALKEDPMNSNAKLMLDGVSSMLGQGSNSGIKSEIEPVPIPAKILETSPADESKSYLQGYGGYYTKFATGVSFKTGSDYRTTDYRVIKVLNESGVAAFSSFEIAFDPLSEGIFVNELSVKDRDGNVLSTGKVDDFYVMDNGVAGEASNHKVLHIPVSGLRTGCEITFTVTRRDFVPDKAFRFTQNLMCRSFPILRSVLFVNAEVDSVKVVASSGIASHTSDGGLWWAIDQPPIWQYEPMQTPFNEFLPVVTLCGSKMTWENVGKEYLTEIKDRLEVDDETRKFADTKTANLATAEEKISALVDCVQKDVTYKAIEFGRRARIPNKADVTVQNRYGDCKDHSLLLRQLLQGVGIQSNLVLVNSKSTLCKELPSLDQFDHMIVFVPSLHGGRFIDCTDKDGDIANCVPSGLAKKEVLILDGEKSRLAKIPDYSPESNQVTAVRKVSLAGETDAMVTEDITFKGIPAAEFRNFFRHSETATRKASFQEFFARKSVALDIHDLEAKNIDDPKAPFCVHWTYEEKGKFHSAGSQLVGQLPAVWERLFFASASADKRQSPFEIRYPITFHSSVDLSFPPEYQCEAIKGSRGGGIFAEYSSSALAAKDSCHFDWTVHEPSARYGAGQYQQFHETTGLVLSAIEQNVVLTKSK